MIDLDVLTQQTFQFFILSMKLSSLVDEFLSAQKKVVVFPKRLIQHFPNSEGTLRKNLCHVYPVLFSFPRNMFFLLSLW